MSLKREGTKVVTIVTVFAARELVQAAFPSLGVDGFTARHVEGVGAHGEKRTSLFDAKNVEYIVVASESLAERIMQWVEDELLPRYPAIAYSTDAVAVLARPPN